MCFRQKNENLFYVSWLWAFQQAPGLHPTLLISGLHLYSSLKGAMASSPCARMKRSDQNLKTPPAGNCLSLWFTSLVFLLTNWQPLENWSQPKWGPLQLVWNVTPETSKSQELESRGGGGWRGCRGEEEEEMSSGSVMYAPGKEYNSVWSEDNSPLITLLDGQPERPVC